MPESVRRNLIFSALVICSMALGAAVVLWLARATVLASASMHLAAYADELLSRDEQLAADINATLAAANATSYPPCSEPDLAFLRTLLFGSPFLKDVGRMHDRLFYCSALAGKMSRPMRVEQQELVTRNGRHVFYNVPLAAAAGIHAEVVALGSSDVVVSPTAFSELSRPNMFYAGWVLGASGTANLKTFQNLPQGMKWPEIPLDKALIQNDSLLYSHCSKTRPDCVTTGLTLSSVWSVNLPQFVAAGTLGAIIGGFVPALILLASRRRSSMPNQLQRAVRHNRLKVVYQPIVDLDTRRVMGCEALVRWKDEDGQDVRPDLFIPVAEERGFIGKITRLVLRHAVQDLSELLRAEFTFSVSVNLSAFDLTDPALIPDVHKILASKSIPAGRVGFELTERSTEERRHITAALHELRANGHTVYIDDFGTGYSSLSYLTELSVDALKVDRAFTNTIGREAVTASIVPQILSMASALNLKVVVEGIETQEQVEYLTQSGGLLGQGWFFGKPVPAPELCKRVMESHARPACEPEFVSAD